MKLSRFFAVQGAVGVVAAAFALSASAQMPDQAVCALQQAVACSAATPCERALPAAVNLPALMRFDLAAGVIESRQENGSVRTSKIGGSSTEGDALVLQGIDAGHPWTIRVNTESGDFTLSVVRDGEGFLGFGVCSAKILK